MFQSRPAPLTPTLPVLVGADVAFGWVLYTHVAPAVGVALWTVAALLVCSPFAGPSRRATDGPRSGRTDG